MKTRTLIIVPALILVTSLCTILIDGQRDTRDHVLKGTPQSAPLDAASPSLVEGTASDSDHDLQTEVIRVAMVKTDEAHARKLGFDWLFDDGQTGFRGSGWSEQPNSTKAEQDGRGDGDKLPK
jgi:hypothetical protein